MKARVAPGRLRLLGTGQALPGPALDTEELLARVARNFGLPTRTGAVLARRLGVATRHHARDWRERLEPPRGGDRNPELAARALQAALLDAGLAPADLQYLLGHTTTPARLLPPNIAEVSQLLGIGAPYGELRQACTGFANALQWASGLLANPEASPVAIVGSETGSAFFDPQALADEPAQWVNLMQMGDGAGAVVLGPDRGEQDSAWIESLFFGHIGLGRAPGFSLEEGGSDFPATRAGRSANAFAHDFDAVRTAGPDLFRAGIAAARAAGVELTSMDGIIPHQANGRMRDWLSDLLGFPRERIHGNGAHVGNLGSASIWVALHDLRMSGRLARGSRILILGAEATQYLYGGFVYVHG